MHTANSIDQVRDLLRRLCGMIDLGKPREQAVIETSIQVMQVIDSKPLSRKEAAEFLCLSLPTFDKWCKEGRVHVRYKDGRRKWGRKYFLKSELVLLREGHSRGHRRP